MSSIKVLLCERTMTGHRKVYMEFLEKIYGIDFYCLAPENPGLQEDHFIAYKDKNKNKKGFTSYSCWIKQIKTIVNNNHIDIVHILDGDSIRRFFGFSMNFFGAKVVLTYHHFFTGKISAISYKLMSGKNQRTIVVHTSSVKDQLAKIGIHNLHVVEYPAFSYNTMANLKTQHCKEYFTLPDHIPTIGIVGGLVKYKRIIPFLRIMESCTKDFRLLICGTPQEITELEINEASKKYREKVVILARKLTDMEYNMAIAASDIVFCVYGEEFDGASGPLTDGVCAGKLILASSHGSLGQIVQENHLGITCDCMNEDEVLRATESAIDRAFKFVYDDTALQYSNYLNPKRFQSDYEKIYEGLCDHE